MGTTAGCSLSRAKMRVCCPEAVHVFASEHGVSPRGFHWKAKEASFATPSLRTSLHCIHLLYKLLALLDHSHVPSSCRRPGPHLAAAEAAAARAGFGRAADWELAQHRYRLGRACSALNEPAMEQAGGCRCGCRRQPSRGPRRWGHPEWDVISHSGHGGTQQMQQTSPRAFYAIPSSYTQETIAVRQQCHSRHVCLLPRRGSWACMQAPAFTALGKHYQAQEDGAGRARRCLQRALALDPCLAEAGQPPRTWLLMTTHAVAPDQQAPSPSIHVVPVLLWCPADRKRQGGPLHVS